MKNCVECGKKLGIIEGYRHPIMGKDTLVCWNCFDTVFESIEKYREFVSPYVGFFNKETSTIDDFQKIGENITNNMKKMQDKVRNLWPHKTNRNGNETVPLIN